MVAPVEVTVDAKGMPLPPIDPNTPIPPNVKRASEAANELHKQAYNTPPPAPEPQAAPAPVQAQPEPTPAPAPPPPPPATPSDDRASWDAAKWEHYAKSMEGRFRQSQEQMTHLQAQMNDMGTELLMRTASPPLQPAQQPLPLSKMVTQQDVETYGEDFLNVAQRAAMDAIAPKLTELERHNKSLESQLRKQTIQSIESVLDSNVPNWPQINLSPKFHNWLRLRDVYSGRVRKELLNEAHRAADAARVLTFFKGFLQEEVATGSTDFLPTQEPSSHQTAPRNPAVELQTLAAPGHARPPQGTPPNQAAHEPAWISRDQISQFYSNVRKGVYVGREQDKLNDEAFIQECQRAGRIR